MEAKKTPEADLENKRTVFFLMGFAVVLSAFYVLMEWKSDSQSGMYSPELLAPVFIENEFDANTQTDTGNQPTEKQPVTDSEKQTETIYEGYQIVDQLSAEEEIMQDSIQNQLIRSIERENQKTEEITQTLKTDADAEDEPDTEAEAMPQFPGGNVALIKFIYSHIQYPAVALKQHIQGRVWCSFIVEQDGAISDVVLEQGVYIFLDEEAVRVLKTMPPWIPGKTQGKNGQVKVFLPIVFKI
jgi:protein TonB